MAIAIAFLLATFGTALVFNRIAASSIVEEDESLDLFAEAQASKDLSRIEEIADILFTNKFRVQSDAVRRALGLYYEGLDGAQDVVMARHQTLLEMNFVGLAELLLENRPELQNVNAQAIFNQAQASSSTIEIESILETLAENGYENFARACESALNAFNNGSSCFSASCINAIIEPSLNRLGQLGFTGLFGVLSVHLSQVVQSGQ